MNRETKLLIAILIIIFLIVSIVLNRRKNVNNRYRESDTEVRFNTSVVTDEEFGEYVVYNNDTGEEITRARDKASIEIYKTVPDYDPKSSSEERDENLVEE